MAGILRAIAGTLVVSVLITAGVLGRIALETRANSPSPAQAIVVLGAAQYNGTPSPVFEARLDHAAQLFRDGAAPRIITTGGSQVGDAWTEAAAGMHYLDELGLDGVELSEVSQGKDTLESLRMTDVLLQQHGWNDVILVTDPWHMARCRAIAQDLGWRVQTSPVTSGPATEDAVRLKYMTRELAAMVFYRLVGGSSGLGSTVL